MHRSYIIVARVGVLFADIPSADVLPVGVDYVHADSKNLVFDLDVESLDGPVTHGTAAAAPAGGGGTYCSSYYCY